VLITLLKTHDYLGDPALGQMWDRSLIYVATEFGRDKARPFLSGGWATGHDLNSGSVIVSVLVRGNAVYGGLNPTTCNTFGFGPATGQKKPDSQVTERDVYGIIAHAFDLDSPATGKFPAVVR
jgi:uncharacterized protein (DUF1501 family)